MKYYSDVTKELYNSEKELMEEETRVLREKEEAKKAEKAKNIERANRAKIVEEAYKAMAKAREDYETVLADFCKDYGYFHTSIEAKDIPNYSNWLNDSITLTPFIQCMLGK